MVELHKMLNEKLSFHDIDISTILFHLHEGVLVADTEGIILYYNTTQSQIDDLDIEYALGKKITDLYRLSENTSTTMRCIKTGLPVRDHVIIYQTRTGKVANTISNVFPIFKNGKIAGAISFTKDYQMLENIISTGKASKKARARDNGTRFTFANLVGNNSGLLNAVNMAKLSADSPSPIMLSGETGTGKEIFAQSIHNYRSASKKKFIPINCSAIPENLLEGILFGTSKGAFTGSIDKAGLFEQANGGTIFMDELDSMPLSLQAKVLRVVQEKKVRRVGSLEETNLNIKIISTVSKDPDTIIKNGSLRLDLFYRMGVVFILIPPLRERMDDMDLLIAHFIAKFNESLGEQVTGISDRVKAIFGSYPWPGNIRELEHVIEGAMNIVNGDHSIRLKHLPGHVLSLLNASGTFFDSSHLSEYENKISRYSNDFSRHNSFFSEEDLSIHMPSGHEDSTVSSRFLSSQQSTKKLTLLESQSANEKEHICNALKETNGNAAKAARMLGLSPQSFHYKIKKYQIDKKKFAADTSNK
ncbi:MAG: sigma 54-interacting transcriptional regulator [Desulfamplus sp.]|nr:sigma 54-interacting transcriptional regulator [Desulfamplus sp.]